jgi:hypothetical protein
LVAQRRGLDVLALWFAGFHVAVGARELWFGMVCMIFYGNLSAYVYNCICI